MIKWLLTSRKAKLAIALILLASGTAFTGAISVDQLLNSILATIITLISSIAIEDGLKGRQLTDVAELLKKFGG